LKAAAERAVAPAEAPACVERVRLWVPVGIIGVSMLWFLSALWNFAHAFILAGGENPLVILEGHMPALAGSGTALAIGLASVGSDVVKATSGFLVVSCATNKNLGPWKRVGAVTIAACLCIPTFVWSARSALGMADIAFGDTIAARAADKEISGSVSTSLETTAARLKWLGERTVCKDKSCYRQEREYAKEAKELRAQLKVDRSELRATKHVGSAAPGAEVISDLTGLSMQRVANLTVAIFIIMVELVSTLGFPALAMASRVAATPGRGEVAAVTASATTSATSATPDQDPLAACVEAATTSATSGQRSATAPGRMDDNEFTALLQRFQDGGMPGISKREVARLAGRRWSTTWHAFDRLKRRAGRTGRLAERTAGRAANGLAEAIEKIAGAQHTSGHALENEDDEAG
jgi:hypothetical protein